MPNWCYQQMSVIGSKKDLVKFAKDCWLVEQDEVMSVDENGKEVKITKVSEGWSLNHLDPIPEDLLDTVAGSVRDEEKTDHEAKKKSNLEKYGYQDWYHYANAVWGSKWGASEVEFQSDSPEKGKVEPEPFGSTNQIRIYIESAWSPAIGLYQRISKKYPNLLFAVYYTEEANMFAGWEVIVNGEVLFTNSVSTDEPDDLIALYKKANEDENSETMDDYYEAHSEWQLSIVDECETQLGKFLPDCISYIRSNAKRKEKVTFREWEDEQLDKS